MKSLKPIVTDTYDFSTLIKRGYVYVDKTALLHRMISGIDGTLFFVSRPRRFGKSLMISTLEQIFRGNRALFKGLDIFKSDYDWKRHPIIRLDMTAFDHTSGLALFKRSLAAELGGKEPVAAFRALIAKKARASHGRGVVVLVDEYDAPVSGLLGKPKELEAMREFLQTFYRILKQEAGSIRFLMMTGVSKFTKLSVFSGLNNLTDLSMDPTYAGLLGYTQEELVRFFSPQIAEFAKGTNRSSKAVVAELLSWYDSYRFSPKSGVRVCNPVSVGRALKEKSCEPFWDRTGNATLIIERLRKLGKIPIDIESVEVDPKRLDVCDLKDLPFAALMYQGGYLTIRSVCEDGKVVLGIPNKEVREAIYGGFLDEVLKADADDFSSSVLQVRRIFASDAVDGGAFRAILQSVFAMVPHEWKLKSEAEAKRYFLLFMKMAGADITPELESSKGRADAIVETEKAVYVFEFKYGKTPRAALEQIGKKGYAKPYAVDKRRVVIIGINYNPRKADIGVVSEVVNPSGEVVNSIDEVVNEVVKSHPGLRKPELVPLVGKSRATVERALSSLISSGRIEFRGAPKNGGYYVR